MNKLSPLSRGLVIFGLLAVLTAVEYVFGLLNVNAVVLWLIALIKGGLVLWYFMHLPRVFSAEGEHES